VPAELRFHTVDAGESPQESKQIEQLLTESDLGWDSRVETFVVCRKGAALVACAGIDRNVVKCVAISPAFRGTSLSLQLGGELLKVAMERGHFHLFYTPNRTTRCFSAAGVFIHWLRCGTKWR